MINSVAIIKTLSGSYSTTAIIFWLLCYLMNTMSKRFYVVWRYTSHRYTAVFRQVNRMFTCNLSNLWDCLKKKTVIFIIKLLQIEFSVIQSFYSWNTLRAAAAAGFEPPIRRWKKRKRDVNFNLLNKQSKVMITWWLSILWKAVKRIPTNI